MLPPKQSPKNPESIKQLNLMTTYNICDMYNVAL